MARENRVVLKDAVYHVTSRVAHREFLFADGGFKDRIAKWIHDIADFSGVEVFAWSILDNHFHLVVHVPRVPKKYWTDPSYEPDSHAFGMRPAECRVSRWSPSNEDNSHDDENGRNPKMTRNSSTGGTLARPTLGFMLSDEEMLDRLLLLYDDPKRIEHLRKLWLEMRERGDGGAVNMVKERYARRMYNISQFVKTLKERIAMFYNRAYKHEGAIWQGRFYSSVVEDTNEVRAIVAAYDDYNPVKAGIVNHPSEYRWSSFGSAMGHGTLTARSQNGYEKMFGCSWSEAKSIMEAIFAHKDAGPSIPTSPNTPIMHVAQAIRYSISAFTRGVYIGHNPLLAKQVETMLPLNFPQASFTKAIERCNRFAWTQSA